MLNMKTAITAAFAFASLSSAHLKLMRPVPYGIDTLNKSPLNNVAPGSSGSDFPCKLRDGVYDIAMMNNMTVGEPQELSFIGSVSHGGGTCQLAITKDQQPTAQSVFKVFQVFEGGCPVNSDGNTGTHPFTFILPKDMPNGVMTFAWIWYNRIGDREIYMNCAPVTISGGSDNEDYFKSLPNAYIINLPTTECQSTFEGSSNAVTIPHPGQYILKSFEGQAMHIATGPNCSAKAAAQLDGVVGYKGDIVTSNGAKYIGLSGNLPPVPHGSSGAVSGYAAPATSAPTASASGQASGAPVPALGFGTATSAPSGGASAFGGASASDGASASAGSVAGGSSAAPAAPSSAAGVSTFSTLVASGSAGVKPSSGLAPTGGTAVSSAVVPSSAVAPSSAAASSAAPSGAVPSGAAPSGAAPSSAAPSGAACSSTSAAMTCSSDGKQFGVCSDGKMVWRAVAPGTTCKDGQITKRSIQNPHVRHSLQRGRKAAL